ncbi:MAG: hypothetical protein AABM43_08325 [Actinomycetota bacterium]
MEGSTLRAVLAAALVVMLLGGGYAFAVDVGRNDVGSRQIKNHAVKKRDLARSVNRRITRGLSEPRPVPGATPVPAGVTIRGAVGGDFHGYDATQASDFGVDVSLPSPAQNALSDDAVFVNVASDTGGATTTDTNPGCTGTPSNPTAAPGIVCIYVAGSDQAFNVNGYSVLPGTGASPFGFKLKWDCSCQGDSFIDGTWAYTAP